MNSIYLKIETLVKIVVGLCGNWAGVTFEYYPNLPNVTSQHISFNGICADCDFLRLTLNDQNGVDCWFADRNGETFYLSLDKIKTNRLFYGSIVTHIYDKMNELIEENA